MAGGQGGGSRKEKKHDKESKNPIDKKVDEEKAKAKEKFDNSAVGKKVNDAKDKAEDKIKEKTGLDKVPNIPTSPKKAEEKAKKELKKKVQQKAKQELAKKGVTKAAIMPILGAVGGFLLFLIIIVGVIMFFVAMPGQVISSLKNMGKALTEKISSLIQGEEDIVYMSDLAEVANYLENMGYDLRGEGFITSDRDSAYSLKDEDTGKNYSEESDKYTFDENQYVWRDVETDKVVALNSDPIQAYIVSDNLCYIIKNFNQNLDEATGGLSGVVVAITVFVGVALAVVFSPLIAIVAVAGAALLFATASNPEWGTGLISIYHEKDGVIGSKGKAYNVKEHGYIELDIDTKKLTIKRGWSNNAYTYDVDGWSGRYGMPLEFLLSVHVATQMPDLAIDMATSFDTDVLVLLREVDNGTIEAGYKLDNGNILSFSEIKEKVADSWLESLFGDNNVSNSEFIELAKIGFPHASNCSCCTHIPGSTHTLEDGETEECEGEETEDNWDAHYVCNACKDYAKTIYKAMKAVNDKDWDSYTPYISQVTDHWFRDVYFVISDLSTEVTEVDEYYFYITSERWTIYETYEEGDDIPDGFEVGDYKYYEYDNGTYTLSTRTKSEVEELEEALANGEDVIRLIKKPATTQLTANDGSVWSAYEDNEEDTVSGWELLEINDDSPSSLQEFKDQGVIYYRETRPGDLTQVEDGQRGVTNDTIKTMFVNNYYYQYDGTAAKADAIEENRKSISSKYSNSDELQEAFQKAMSDFADIDEDGVDSNTGVNTLLISRVSIAKDSLNAFSMLENTHTLDADYIYRDFKELIVELNYFDKEDLSDKVQTVMQWILPDTGSGGWPIRAYEKGETYYGTLINSKADLELLRTSDDDEDYSDVIDSYENAVTSSDSEESTTTTSSSTYSVSTSTSTEGNSAIISKAQEIIKYMYDDGKWPYAHGVSGRRTWEAAKSTRTSSCATFVTWVLQETGYLETGEIISHGSPSTSNESVYEKYNDHLSQATWYYPMCKTSEYDDLQPGDVVIVQASNNSWRSIAIYAGKDSNGKNMYYGAISGGSSGRQGFLGNAYSRINASYLPGAATMNCFESGTLRMVIRFEGTGTASSFEGYTSGEDVVSPVTGKIVDYGEVTRTNEETGEDENVEYIKIEAMNVNLYNEEGDGYKSCSSANDTFDDLASENDKNYEGYDYFYEEYQGVIDGYVVYIEGFDLTIDEILESGNTDEVVSKYVANEVDNMVDDEKEAQAIWKEDAKSSALPLVKIGDDWYIKEGTVIGLTYEDSEDTDKFIKTVTNSDGEEETVSTGNGNYIRIIMRDLEDAIIEDVEEYMIIDNGTSQSGDQEYQFEEGDLDLLADAIHHEGCGSYCDPSGSDGDKLYLSISVGYTIINKLNSDSGYTHAAGLDWAPDKSQLYNLVCVIPCAAHGGKGWYAISDEPGHTRGGLYYRANASDYEYCDLCMQAAEYIKENDSLNFKNNGKYNTGYSSGEGMPHTCWEQGANYYGGTIWAEFRGNYLFDPKN